MIVKYLRQLTQSDSEIQNSGPKNQDYTFKLILFWHFLGRLVASVATVGKYVFTWKHLRGVTNLARCIHYSLRLCDTEDIHAIS